MSCSKDTFLNIYNGSKIKDLQSQINANLLLPGNNTPNIDFLNKAWSDYEKTSCKSFVSAIENLNVTLRRYKKNTLQHQLQLEKIDFYDKLRFSCKCSEEDVDKKKFTKVIKEIVFDESSIPVGGADRTFTIKGDKGGVFDIFIKNAAKKYYNFETRLFEVGTTGTRYVLKDVVMQEHGTDILVRFPKVAADDHYDITVFANPEFNTHHAAYKEVRFNDINKTLDINSCSGSDSAVLHKKLYQYTDNTITLSAISPNALSAFSSNTITTQQITATKYGSKIKVPFTITWTANVSKPVHIGKQPGSHNLGTFVERTIGSAAIPIEGEDVSGSTYYKCPINNVVGLKTGMAIYGNNVTANSKISDYIDSVDISQEEREVIKSASEVTEMKSSTSGIQLQKTISNLEGESTRTSKFGNETVIRSRTAVPRGRKSLQGYLNVAEAGVQTTGSPTVTNGVVTAQPGNIVLNKQQADALKDDTIKVVAYTPDRIKSLTGYEFKVSNIKAELTKPTTTTTAVVSGSRTIPVADREGILNNVSRISGIGIDPSSADPVVTAGGKTDGAGNWTAAANQTLESGITLTIENTGRIVTITGDIEFSKIGEDDVTIFFDVEQFLLTS